MVVAHHQVIPRAAISNSQHFRLLTHQAVNSRPYRRPGDTASKSYYPPASQALSVNVSEVNGLKPGTSLLKMHETIDSIISVA